MTLGCNGLCTEEASAHGIKYDLGWKRCTTCFKKLKTDAIKCYCCNYKLRGKTRKAKYKKEKVRL